MKKECLLYVTHPDGLGQIDFLLQEYLGVPSRNGEIEFMFGLICIYENESKIELPVWKSFAINIEMDLHLSGKELFTFISDLMGYLFVHGCRLVAEAEYSQQLHNQGHFL